MLFFCPIETTTADGHLELIEIKNENEADILSKMDAFLESIGFLRY